MIGELLQVTDERPLDTEKPKGVGVNGNLILPQKGEIRNPKGKPLGTRNRSTIVREIVEAAAAAALSGKVNIGVQPKTIFEQLVIAQVIKASLGDTTAATFIADSAFGKLTDKVNTTHTFRKMGDVVVQPDKDHTGNPEPKALSFDIGEDPPPVEGEVLESEGELNGD